MATIILVDDNPVDLQVTRKALEVNGHRVEVSENAWIASRIQDVQPDLILMDVNLGSILSGPMAVESLRRADFSQSLKIYLYSSTERRELDKLAAGCGADGVIPKGGVKLVQEAVERALGPGAVHSGHLATH